MVDGSFSFEGLLMLLSDYLSTGLGRNTRMDYRLKNMHCLTSPEPMEVEVELSKINATKLVLSAYNYGQIQVEGPSTNYTHCMQVSDQQHTGFDFFGYRNGMTFITRDRSSGSTCAEKSRGGWWFNDCYNIHLTLDGFVQLFQRRTAMSVQHGGYGNFMRFDHAELRGTC